MQQTFDYGRTARIGVGTPQGNPTVEAEFGILLPRSCSLYVARLTACAPDGPEKLREYLRDLAGPLQTYDILKPDIFGFACTGSSYLYGVDGEAEILETIGRQVSYPIVTAAHALRWALDHHKAKRIAIVAPYPRWLLDAAGKYWSDLGYNIVTIEQIPTGSSDTRAIYKLGSAAPLPALAKLDLDALDAVLMSGTGMPSLALLKAAPVAKPLISSNFCLAACLLQRTGHGNLLDANLNIAGWRGRLAEAMELA
jgi:maleate isomerase